MKEIKNKKRRKMEKSVTNIDVPTSINVLHDSLNYILTFRVTFKKFKIINMMSFLIIYSLLLKIRFYGIGGDSPPTPLFFFLFIFLFLFLFSLSYFYFLFLFLFSISFLTQGGFPPNPPFLFYFSFFRYLTLIQIYLLYWQFGYIYQFT